jgi:hypothetical protein
MSGDRRDASRFSTREAGSKRRAFAGHIALDQCGGATNAFPSLNGAYPASFDSAVEFGALAR